MTKHFRTITFQGAGEFAGCATTASYAPLGNQWDVLQDAVAREYDLDPESISMIEAYWGGHDGDADGAELVILDGKLIGAINRTLTADEFAVISAIPHFGDVLKTAPAERAKPTFAQPAE